MNANSYAIGNIPLGISILDLELIVGIFPKHFNSTIIDILHDFGEGLLVSVYYHKRSSVPYSNFLADYLLVLNYLEVTF